MTRSDSDEPDPGQDNPFDLGLPMLRPPARQPSRRPGRRGTRRRPPPSRPAPMPIPGTDDRSGDWEEWLNQGARQPDPPPEAPTTRVPTREYDYSDDDGPVQVPQIVDRSGGSAGSRLRRARSRRPDDGRRRDKVLSLLILVGVGIVVVAVVLTVIHTGNRRNNTTAAASVPAVVEDTAPHVAPPTTAPASPAPIATADCEQRRDADEVSGTDPGGTSSGPDAILAFERAYYVQRSGSAARAVVTDDATVSSASSGPSAFPAAENIQRGINQVPVGTRYCVQVTRGSSDGSQWEVRLTQQKPGEQPHTFTQIVSTRTISDRTLISAIKEG
ncbi:hypothetical protein [Nocardia jiangxiensis]|uniref:hypothetical protein n=1 Tax=Nocardia jiangxiensis TaxID=282685 RepID=UPI0002DC65A3|nr:hypothetical protein [Nocardia jiangxiensis]